jgi:signal transduction histidine kinase
MKQNRKKLHSYLQIFLFTFTVLVALMSIQKLILNKAVGIEAVRGWYGKVSIIYWVVVAIIFTLLTRYQISRYFERPMMSLAKAAKEVAEGDFSVYVPPLHTAEKQDYMDMMFLNFNTMVEALGSIETLKTEFFSNVSHEIKTPLAIILNYAETLQMDQLTPELRKEYTEIIIKYSKQLSELITTILKLNKLEKQVIEPRVETYDLCSQLCECALRFEDLWERKSIEFEAGIEDRAMIEADESLLELVWNNLLSNAVKFTEAGGTITLRQTSTEEEAIVSVIDTGCGMSQETMKHIFDKFYQGDTSRSSEGNGLGLTLALRVIQLAGGRIEVDSELGVGTAFTVYLPVRSRF